MAFTINTNIASLQAQENLRLSSDMQAKTINRVTSGLRIVNSGDDAAGLAIANGYRSDVNVLTQGVRNANDGLSQLQIIDGGMNNISKLLDRARTLATQSASGTFTGDRGVLNDEFKNVISEIDRQSQAIGLNVGGTFAKELSVFIGGGKGTTDSAVVTNGSVKVDLSASTVDSGSLGLKGVQAKGTADLSGKTVATTVSAILGDASNQASLRTTGYTEFYVVGPGFDENGSSAIKLSVNTTGIASASQLADAINAAITTAASGATQEATAFKNSGIQASIVKDATTGSETLAFSSSTTAFQVRGGDQVANAFMGNITGSAGDVDFSKISYTPGNTSSAVLALTWEGGSSTLNAAAVTAATVTDWAASLNAAIASTSAASDFTAVVDGTTVSIVSRSGMSFNITATDGGGLGIADGATQASSVVNDSWFNAQGAYTVGNGADPFAWANFAGAEEQAVTITATDAQGTIHSKTIQLTATNATTLDEALDTINDTLRATNDTTLQNIVAMKDAHGGVTGVRFNSTLTSFNVSLGKEVTGNHGIGGTDQGSTYTAAQAGTGSTADISTEQSALSAVGALSKAVEALGKAQAVIGKGQNQFNYAVNLAQSQLSNLAAAESRIRDADLAAEAANLTKAQTAIQAGIAALAQANSAPQAVLGLLRG